MNFFTADTHFYHVNIIKYCNRPFSSVQVMNETLIKNWNSKVTNKDTIYVLGDFCLAHKEEYVLNLIKELNGHKIFLIGSHDKALLNLNKLNFHNFEIKKERILEIYLKNKPVILSHYAMRVWPKSHYNSYHLYGHSHGKLPSFGKSIDVGVDIWKFFPVSENEIFKALEKLPDNFNKVL